MSGHTVRAYKFDFKQFMAVVERADLAQVTRADIYEYRQWLVGRYAPSTVNRKLSLVRSLFAEAVRAGECPSSPAEGVKGHRTERSGFSSTKAPSEEQVRAVLDTLKGSTKLTAVRDRALLYLMAHLGLRRDEVCKLTPQCIVEDQGYTCLDITGKGSKRRREVIPPTSLSAVRQWIEFGGIGEDEPLFPRITHGKRKGGALTGSGVWYIVRRRFGKVGVTGLSPHSLRHFAITELLKHGMALHRVQDLAGHADPSTTQRYNHGRGNLADSADRYVTF
jgi:site-specific recombinase XerD